MSIEELLQEVQSSYTRIKQAESRARYGYDHYLDDLKTIYTQKMQAIEDSFRQGRLNVKAEYQRQLTNSNNGFEQASQQAKAQLAEMTANFRWAVSPWNDPAWNTYEPALRALAQSGLRVGRLNIEEAKDFPELPALAAFIGHGPLFITSEQTTIPAAQQLLRAMLFLVIQI